MWMQYMKPVKLQIKKTIEKPSGARIEEWQTLKEIDAAIFQEPVQNQFSSTGQNQSGDINFIQYDYTALTKADVNLDNRLIENGKVFKVEAVVPAKRYNQLYLKVIEDE